MSKKPPEILYKYRTYNELSLSILTNQEVYFSSPYAFNDPFDCLAQEYMLSAFIKKMMSSLSLVPRAIPIPKEKIEKYYLPLLARLLNEPADNFKEFTDVLGILALSACKPDSNKSILMWSHYADNHKGFCIGFRNNLGFDEKWVNKVSYTAKRNNDFAFECLALLDYVNLEVFIYKYIEDFICTKYDVWGYEEEWSVNQRRKLTPFQRAKLTPLSRFI